MRIETERKVCRIKKPVKSDSREACNKHGLLKKEKPGGKTSDRFDILVKKFMEESDNRVE